MDGIMGLKMSPVLPLPSRRKRHKDNKAFTTPFEDDPAGARKSRRKPSGIDKHRPNKRARQTGGLVLCDRVVPRISRQGD